MANVPWQNFAQGYASTIGKSYDPVINAITGRISDLQGRIAGAPETVGGLFTGAETAAGTVGANISNIGNQFLSAVGGMNLPNMDPNALALAARSTARGGATGAMLQNVLQSQVGQARASATLEAQRRLADELSAAQMEQAQAESERAKTSADWLQYAGQRQGMETQRLQNQALRNELRNAPIQRRSMILDNQLKRGQITQQEYDALAAEYKLNQAGVSTGKPSTPAGPGKKWSLVNGKWVKVPV